MLRLLLSLKPLHTLKAAIISIFEITMGQQTAERQHVGVSKVRNVQILHILLGL